MSILRNEATAAPTRAALYYRVSTPGQVEGFGYDAQRRLLPEHAARMGWEVAGEYEEPGVSGDFLTNRPAMMQLLADAQAGKLDLVLVIEDSRLSRGDLAEWQFIKAVCDQHEIQLATPQGVFYRPGNDDDDFLTDVRGAMSKREKKLIARRMARGKREALAKGCLVHGQPPYGYRFVRCGKNPSEKRLDIVEEQARVVRLIFELATYGDGESGPLGCSRIAAHLQGLGIPTARGTGPWSGATVKHIIRNSVHKGVWHFGKVEACLAERPRVERPKRFKSSGRERPRSEWVTVEDPAIIPPIVSPELWQAANDAADRRFHGPRGRPSSRPSRPFLAGFLRCPHCGFAMVYHRHKYTTAAGEARECCQYTCPGRNNPKKLGIPTCQQLRWKADLLEDAVWQELLRIVRSPDLLRTMIAASEAEAPQAGAAEPLLLEKSLAALEEAEAAVKRALLRGTYTDAEFDEEIGKVRQEREALEARLAGLAEQMEERAEWERAVSQAIDYCKAYRKVAADAPPSVRRGMLEDLVDTIEIASDRTLTVNLIFGTASQARVQAGSIPISETSSGNRFGIGNRKPLAVALRALVSAPR